VSREEKIGRGHPPSGRQFGRGQRRAPGRPKGAIGEKAIVKEIAGELHEVRDKGEKKLITTYELLLKSMRNLAMSADLRAAKWLSTYLKQKIGDPDDGCGLLVVPEQMPVEKWIERQNVLNKFRTDPELREDPFFTDLALRNGSVSVAGEDVVFL
jgi:uncharacterized protein DUF5681